MSEKTALFPLINAGPINAGPNDAEPNNAVPLMVFSGLLRNHRAKDKCEEPLVRGRKELPILVDTGVGQASREVLDEKVAKESACGISVSNPHCVYLSCWEDGKADIPNIPRTSYDSCVAQI